MVRRKINQAIDETNGLLRIQVRPFKLNRDAFSQRVIKQRVFRGDMAMDSDLASMGLVTQHALLRRARVPCILEHG